jgi:anti-sigma B factor antagonist
MVITALDTVARFERDLGQVSANQGLSPTSCPQDRHFAIVSVKGALRAPVHSKLNETLEAIIRQGERRVLLDLGAVDEVDAAGIGELISAFNVVRASGGVLRIAHANRYVRCVLEISGVFTLLTEGPTNDAENPGRSRDSLRGSHLSGHSRRCRWCRSFGCRRHNTDETVLPTT